MKITTIIDFYLDGFKNLSPTGKKLWIIIALKICIFFVVVKLLFFPDVLHTRYKTDKQRADFVLENLTGGEK